MKNILMNNFGCVLVVPVVILNLVLSLSAIDYERGKIGCLYTTIVCNAGQTCVDDSLFGVCSDRKEEFSEAPQVSINVEQAIELEQILNLLVDYEYSWESAYVQCILKYYLHKMQSSQESPAFPEFCNRAEERRRKKDEEKEERKLENERKFEQEKIDEEARKVADQSGRELSWLDRFNLGRGGSGNNGGYGNGGVYSDKGNGGIESYVDRMVETDLAKVEDELGREEMNSHGDDPNSIVGMKVDVEMDSEAKNNEDGQPNGYQDTVNPTHDYQPLLLTSTLFPMTSRSYYDHFYKPSTQPLYKSYYRPYSAQIASKDLVRAEPIERSRLSRSRQKYFVTMYVLCGFILISTFLAVVLYFVRRRSKFREKFLKWANKGRQDSTGDYQDLCRHHMQSKLSEKLMDSPLTPPYGRHNRAIQNEPSFHSPPPTHRTTRTSSTNSSSSSWNDEPSNSNLDISTGHLILAYMEEHIKDKDRLQREWDELSNNDPEPCSIVAAIEPANMRKNRCTDIMPYEHTRVRLNPANNVSGSDYINANFIVDNDPRNPNYIVTQGPLPHTVADFWQMIWEQNSVVVVSLTRLTDNSTPNCHRYWPEEGTELYHIYEVQLISEHVLCEDFVVRSLVLKCIQTSETRTVTQFHFTSWPSLSTPPSTRVLLDFRRKVNKSYRSRLSPIVVHCGDGAGRSGTYCLIDMTLNRLNKGAKEINIAAGLEHLRDQRINLIRTKDQFAYALTAIAEEVQSVLNVPQM